MAHEDFDPLSYFDTAMAERAAGGFYDSPATAREAGVRRQSQAQDLALNQVRQMLGLQEESANRQLAAKGAQERETLGVANAGDPTKQYTQGIMGGRSPEDSMMKSLHDLIEMKNKGNFNLGGKEHLMAQKVIDNLYSDFEKQVGKAPDPDNPSAVAAYAERRKNIAKHYITIVKARSKAHPELAPYLHELSGIFHTEAGKLLGSMWADDDEPAGKPRGDFEKTGNLGGTGTMQPRTAQPRTQSSVEDILNELIGNMGFGG